MLKSLQVLVCGASLAALLPAQAQAPSNAQLNAAQAPAVRLLEGFEHGQGSFDSSDAASVSITPEHATEGKSALRVAKGYVSWRGAQNWSGYDFLEADVFNASDDPAQIYVEIHDKATTDYWTRVNYTTVVPPGASRLLVPTDIYVGEKSRPGHALDLANITRLVLSVQDSKAPIFFDNLRLERDLSDSIKVPGLRAFSFGPGTSPPLSGFTSVTPGTNYSPERGFGFQKARLWKAFDVLQPDPLYARSICIEGGGFTVDVPDGRYHVFLNIDSPGGFWGENQIYRERSIKANGTPVLDEKMDMEAFKKRYFRFSDVEDRLSENTFDKYLSAIFHEKEFDVDVQGGKLNLEFNGQNRAITLSALVIYPAAQAEAGRKYLANLRERRRFYFDNYFKRVAPNGSRDSKGVIPTFVPNAGEQAAGYALFSRDWMENVPVNAIPRREEVGRNLSAFASAGQMEPIVFSIHGLRDQGNVRVGVSDLVSGGARVPGSAVSVGVVSHRLTRVTGEGTIYTISPRFVMPRNSATIRQGETTTFWLTLHAPRSLKAGTYTGKVTLTFADGKTDTLNLSVRLFATPLDELDVAAGPWGSTLDLPWFGEETGSWNRTMFQKSLAKIREYGFTTFSGIPNLSISGWKDKVPQIDFAQADQQMADAKTAGFKRIVVNYNGGIQGFDNYHIDTDAMKAAGFDKYTHFLRAVLTPIAAHARAANWLPVAFNLCDEPIGDAVASATDNARAWREAAPPEIITTGATSVESSDANDPQLKLAQALKIANLSNHSVASIKAIHDGGGDWSYYNDGSRWTMGTYMFKAARDYNMKFRLEWHWNEAQGDPYYALDSREDDYSWVSTNARGDLISTIKLERDMREGIDDYRYIETLARLLKEKPNHAGAQAARKLLDDEMASFQLGERSPKGPMSDFSAFRFKVAQAIEQMSS